MNIELVVTMSVAEYELQRGRLTPLKPKVGRDPSNQVVLIFPTGYKDAVKVLEKLR